MLRVYLDDILQDQKDVINVSESFQASIVREDGYDNTTPILREKTDATLDFCGNAYSYICSKRRESYCDDISISIRYECNDETTELFNGYVKQRDIEIYPDRCIAKAITIRDNSFSAKFRDFMNVEIGLYNTKTRNCEDLATIAQSYVFSTDPTNVAGSQVTKQGYDVLDTLQYLLNYITDNTVTIQSDYLTTNTYAIAKGYALHTTSGELDDIYPSVSFEKLFTELRKKLNLYMAIEYDENDNPYLRIEQESYFFSDEVLLTINGKPNGIKETLNTNQIFNKITVGSTITKNDDSLYKYYPNIRAYGWINETYGSCSNCTGDKDSTIDLTNDFIIHSNIFYEALNTPDGGDYNNDSIYLFNYEFISGVRTAKIVTEPLFSKNIYNYELTNDRTLSRWSETTSQCIAFTRNSGSSFYVASIGVNKFIETSVTTADPAKYAQNNFQGTTIFDASGSVSVIDTIATNPYGNEFPNTVQASDNASVFTVPADGRYKFHAKSTYLSCIDDFSYNTNIDIRYYLTISIYQDNTLAVLVGEYSDEQSPYRSDVDGTIYDQDLEVFTPELTLNNGNVVFVKMIVKIESDGVFLLNDGNDFCERDTIFELVFDDNNCQNAGNGNFGMPYVVEFQYPICLSDYQKMRNNKNGRILVDNYEYYIREVKYVPQKISTLKLIGNETMCVCTI